jgi:hypothetical protein
VKTARCISRTAGILNHLPIAVLPHCGDDDFACGIPF